MIKVTLGNKNISTLAAKRKISKNQSNAQKEKALQQVQNVFGDAADVIRRQIEMGKQKQQNENTTEANEQAESSVK